MTLSVATRSRMALRDFIHRQHDRFQRSRRHVDDLPSDLFAANLLETVGDGFDVPIGNVGLRRRESVEGLVREGPEIRSVN
jgi:hypothetical protein